MTTAPDKPRNGLIFLFLIVSIVVIVGLGITIQQLFNLVVTGQIDEKVLGAAPSQLKALRDDEARKLSVGTPAKYAWVDQKAGVVRIPLDKAIELTLRDWSKRPTAPVPAAAGAPGNVVPTSATPGGTQQQGTPPSAQPAPAGQTASPGGQTSQASGGTGKTTGETAPKANPAPATPPQTTPPK